MPDIKDVVFSPEVVQKLWEEHRLTQDEVEEVIYDPTNDPRWDVDQIHGGRVVILGETKRTPPRRLFVAIQLVDPGKGLWSCITAFEPTSDEYGEQGES